MNVTLIIFIIVGIASIYVLFQLNTASQKALEAIGIVVDKVTSYGEDGVQSFQEKTRDIQESVGDKVRNNNLTTQSNLDKISQTTSNVGRAAIRMKKQNTEFLQNMVQTTGQFANQITQSISQSSNQIISFPSIALGKSGEALSRLESIREIGYDSAQSGIDQIQQVTSHGFDKLSQFSQSTTSILSGAAAFTAQAGAQTISAITSFSPLATIVPTIPMQFVPSLAHSVTVGTYPVQLFTGALTRAGKIISDILSNIGELPENILNLLKMVFENPVLPDEVLKLFGPLQFDLPNIYELLRRALLDKYLPYVGGVIDSVTDIGKTVAGDKLDKIAAYKSLLATPFFDPTNPLVSVQFVAAIGRDITTIGSKLEDFYNQTIDAIAKGLDEVKEGFEDFIEFVTDGC